MRLRAELRHIYLGEVDGEVCWGRVTFFHARWWVVEVDPMRSGRLRVVNNILV